jgi:hypothetical protein
VADHQDENPPRTLCYRCRKHPAVYLLKGEPGLCSDYYIDNLRYGGPEPDPVSAA